MDENEINNLIFKINCEVDKGNHSDFSMTFVEEFSTEYLILDIDASFKVDFTNMRNIRL